MCLEHNDFDFLQKSTILRHCLTKNKTMKKIVTLLLFVAFTALSFGQQPEAVIQKSEIAPEVDGEIDDLWEGITVNLIDKNFQSEEPTIGESSWQAVWVPFDGIYILVIVGDDEWLPLYETGTGATYEYDKPEVYFDCNLILPDGGGASGGPANGHHQIAAWADDESFIGGGGPFEDGDDEGVLYSFKVNNDADYLVEYYVPFDYLVDENGSPADISGQLGFDVTVIDRDSGDPSRKRAVWANIGGSSESWNNMDDCGIITFEGAEPPIYIDGITLTGGEITINNGSLKLPVSLDPPEANEGLIWSITTEAGGRAPIATINGLGEITAKQNGTVSVSVKSASDAVSATADVVITNQLVTLADINLVRNGFFDDYDAEDLSPLEWGGSDGEIPPYVDNGFVSFDPEAPAEDAAPWSFVFSQSQFGCNSTDDYTFSFLAWAEVARNIMVDFEDPSNNYNRYGVSESPLALPADTEWNDNVAFPWTGNSMWSMDLTTEPVSFVLDVVFSEMKENTSENIQFMFGLADERVFLDSVVLVNNLDMDLLQDYVAVSEITVSAADGATMVALDETLQMSAEVLPAEADYQDVVWSVIPGDGDASITEDGLLSGDTTGTVMVVATATDDSKVMGTYDVWIGYPSSVPQQRVQSLNLYPNPAVNELNVVLSIENNTVAIYSSVGQLMEKVLVKGKEYKFDISNYASGIYFVKTGNSIGKFVK